MEFIGPRSDAWESQTIFLQVLPKEVHTKGKSKEAYEATPWAKRWSKKISSDARFVIASTLNATTIRYSNESQKFWNV